jgi:hypothetical protein
MDATTERPVASVEPTPAVTAPAQQSRLLMGISAEVPPRVPYDPEHPHWIEFAVFPNFWEAHVVGGLLESHDIPVLVGHTWPDPSLTSRSFLCVPPEMAHRARWILAWPPPGEAELNFLATGELD